MMALTGSLRLADRDAVAWWGRLQPAWGFSPALAVAHALACSGGIHAGIQTGRRESD